MRVAPFLFVFVFVYFLVVQKSHHFCDYSIYPRLGCTLDVRFILFAGMRRRTYYVYLSSDARNCEKRPHRGNSTIRILDIEILTLVRENGASKWIVKSCGNFSIYVCASSCVDRWKLCIDISPISYHMTLVNFLLWVRYLQIGCWEGERDLRCGSFYWVETFYVKRNRASLAFSNSNFRLVAARPWRKFNAITHSRPSFIGSLTRKASIGNIKWMMAPLSYLLLPSPLSSLPLLFLLFLLRRFLRCHPIFPHDLRDSVVQYLCRISWGILTWDGRLFFGMNSPFNCRSRIEVANNIILFTVLVNNII